MEALAKAKQEAEAKRKKLESLKKKKAEAMAKKDEKSAAQEMVGAAAGLVAGLFCHPFEVIRTRLCAGKNTDVSSTVKWIMTNRAPESR